MLMRIRIPFSSFNRGDNLQYWVVFWMGVWVMWMRLVRVLAVLAATYQATIGQAATSQAATAKNIGSIHVGSWAGGVFTEKTGEFGFCAATTAVEGDYLLTVGQNGDRFWVLAINIPENISFAIKQGALRDFLDNSAVPYKTANAQTERKTAEITSAARAYTMLIYCKAKEAERTKK
jgi:hypothetical protein